MIKNYNNINKVVLMLHQGLGDTLMAIPLLRNIDLVINPDKK